MRLVSGFVFGELGIGERVSSGPRGRELERSCCQLERRVGGSPCCQLERRVGGGSRSHELKRSCCQLKRSGSGCKLERGGSCSAEHQRRQLHR